MTVALATSWIDAAYEHVTPAAERWTQVLRALDVRTCLLQRVPARPRTTGQALRTAGVSVVGLAVPFAQLSTLGTQTEAAAALRAQALVVDGGPVKDRATEREARTEALARLLYPAHAAGVPLALCNGSSSSALLGLQETSWILEELPGVGLVLDAARAEQAGRDGWDAGLDAWLEAWAGRTVAVVATGLGSDGRGRRHPEDGPLDWSTLSARVSRTAPWIFDPAEDLGEDEVVDGLRALRGLRL